MAYTRRTLKLEERVHAVKNYYLSEKSYKNVIDHWNESFDTPPPSKSTIYELVQKFERTGNVADADKSGAPSIVRTIINRDLVASSYVNSPRKSQRRASAELGISRSSLQRIMSDIGLHPYRPQALQALNEDDGDRRLQFCESFVAYCEDFPNFLNHIIWSDEACFKLNGRVNRHNCVYWSDSNPHEILQQELNLPGVTVWGGLCSSGLIGPFFFDNTVTGESYLKMLNEKLWSIVSKRDDCADLYFQQDGAPAHYAVSVRKWLDEHFPGRWIGRRGPVEWPARSPDLTPLDFFLWGVLKNKVFSDKPKTLNDLKQSIIIAWEDITPEMCKKVTKSIIERCHHCIANNGLHFEHLL